MQQPGLDQTPPLSSITPSIEARTVISGTSCWIPKGCASATSRMQRQADGPRLLMSARFCPRDMPPNRRRCCVC